MKATIGIQDWGHALSHKPLCEGLARSQFSSVVQFPKSPRKWVDLQGHIQVCEGIWGQL